MSRDIRVLVTSISKKVPLLKCVKNALQYFGENSVVFGADIDDEALGKYFVDQFWKMPKLNDLTESDVLKYCKIHAINVIIPTRDGELIFWSKLKSTLLENGIHVMISDTSSIETCIDKQLFFKRLKSLDFSTPTTCSQIVNVNSNKFVAKERVGAGSIGVGLNLTKEEALTHAKTLKDPIFQPFISGDEYTVDLYVDHQLHVHGVLPRKRILIVNGESQITETVQNKQLEEVCKNAAISLKLKGHVLFQVIQETNSNLYYIIECNARFGGASTLSVFAGLDSFRWFFHESLNEKLPEFKRVPHETRLIRHAEDTYISL